MKHPFYALVVFNIAINFAQTKNNRNYGLMTKPHENTSSRLDDADEELDYKLIIFWTPFFDRPDHFFGFGQSPFRDHFCTESRCFTSADKSRYAEASAVIFHARDEHFSDALRLTDRPESQLWVYFLMEPPIDSHSLNGPELKQYNGLFNLTMTYRRDSDIPSTYGLYTSNPSRRISSTKKQYTVAWMASNCKTQSRREDYVKALNRYIHVHMFGKCAPNNIMRPEKYFENYIVSNFKFYLAFENSLCKDYVTEKVWRCLQYGVVPVVLGGADYDKILPPGSFINARYLSPKNLALKLHHIASDERLYQTYFDWKEHYDAKAYTDLKRMCDLCQYLWENNDTKTVYYHLDEWWNGKTDCKAPGDWDAEPDL